MTVYSVLEPPDGNPDKVVFVPEGFAWFAFAFTFLWALRHRLWVLAALLFALSAALTVATSFEVLDPVMSYLINFGAALILGFEGRRLQAMSFERAGFRRAGLIQASRQEAAELAYFAQRAPSTRSAAQTRFRPPADDTLGIFGNV